MYMRVLLYRAYSLDELLDVIEVLREERPEQDLYQDVCAKCMT